MFLTPRTSGSSRKRESFNASTLESGDFEWHTPYDDSSNINLMRHHRWIALTSGIGIAAALLLYAAKTDGMNVMTGPKAFTNTASLSPGLARKITAQDLPQPQSPAMLPRARMYMNLIGGFARPGKRPENAIPKVPAGFKVDIFVGSGLKTPRQMRRAPNGDIFMADTGAGIIRIFRGITADGQPRESSLYASLPGAFAAEASSHAHTGRAGDCTSL